jgi:hypothetical protein
MGSLRRERKDSFAESVRERVERRELDKQRDREAEEAGRVEGRCSYTQRGTAGKYACTRTQAGRVIDPLYSRATVHGARNQAGSCPAL